MRCGSEQRRHGGSIPDGGSSGSSRCSACSQEPAEGSPLGRRCRPRRPSRRPARRARRRRPPSPPPSRRRRPPRSRRPLPRPRLPPARPRGPGRPSPPRRGRRRRPRPPPRRLSISTRSRCPPPPTVARSTWKDTSGTRRGTPSTEYGIACGCSSLPAGDMSRSVFRPAMGTARITSRAAVGLPACGDLRPLNPADYHKPFRFIIEIVESPSNPRPLSPPVVIDHQDCNQIGQYVFDWKRRY
jgi:hypothetical protein